VKWVMDETHDTSICKKDRGRFHWKHITNNSLVSLWVNILNKWIFSSKYYKKRTMFTIYHVFKLHMDFKFNFHIRVIICIAVSVYWKRNGKIINISQESKGSDIQIHAFVSLHISLQIFNSKSILCKQFTILDSLHRRLHVITFLTDISPNWLTLCRKFFNDNYVWYDLHNVCRFYVFNSCLQILIINKT
jgi:hypothetical protein